MLFQCGGPFKSRDPWFIRYLKIRSESRCIKMPNLPKHCLVKFLHLTKRLKNSTIFQQSVKLLIKT